MHTDREPWGPLSNPVPKAGAGHFPPGQRLSSPDSSLSTTGPEALEMLCFLGQQGRQGCKMHLYVKAISGKLVFRKVCLFWSFQTTHKDTDLSRV